jgi:hypothetical protein
VNLIARWSFLRPADCQPPEIDAEAGRRKAQTMRASRDEAPRRLTVRVSDYG